MDIEHTHAFELSEARERVRALGEYLANKHGMHVTWLDDDRAQIRGKYAVVTIDAQVSLEGNRVKLTGKDPGMLWRAAAKQYIARKLGTYLDPSENKDALPRR